MKNFQIENKIKRFERKYIVRRLAAKDKNKRKYDNNDEN